MQTVQSAGFFGYLYLASTDCRANLLDVGVDGLMRPLKVHRCHQGTESNLG